MTKSDWMVRAGVTPGKLALVGVLAIVLIAVIVGQLPEGSVDSPQDITDSAAKRSKPSPQDPGNVPETRADFAIASTNQGSMEQPIRTWPKLPMERILAYDPMAIPEWFAAVRDVAPPVDEASRLSAEAERQQRNEQVLTQLRDQGAKAVVFSGNDKRAAIGQQSVRIGETIEGFKIIDITHKGVVLTEFEPQ